MAKSTDEKLGDLIRRLSSDFDGEIVATVHALRRALKSAGRDLHQLESVIEKNGNTLSEAEMDRLFSAGYDSGKADGLEEARRDIGFYAVGDEDDDHDWREIIRFCFERKARQAERRNIHREHGAPNSSPRTD
jgi:hypothetical protein